ncbi:hypothetical protein [Aeromicrobium sp. UC242_57]|uniref:hypothetical protein n=1 Tax=Aeromicrobium sp. UC242_57 TaxID=3374624 RepID=UPI0037B20F7D
MKRLAIPVLAFGAAIVAANITAATAAPATAEAVLVAGNVADAAGEPAAGARVAVFAEPADSESLKAGESAFMPLIGTATTDANGAYAVELPDDFALNAHADPAGILTFTAVAQDGAHVQTADFQRQVDTAVPVSRLVAVDSAKAYDASRVRASKLAAVPESLSFDLTSKDTQVVQKTASRATGDVSPMSTSVSVVKDYGSRWAYVGQWASTTSAVKSKFYYSKSSSTSLGVAVSPTGKAGSFKAGASKSRSSSAEIGFPTRTGKTSVKFRSQFHYQKRQYLTCTAGWTCSDNFKIEPISWRGGTSTLKRNLPSATKCTSYEKGSSFSKANTAAYEFNAGVSNSGMTVVELSARSGFTSTVKQTVSFTGAAKLCGRQGYPTGSPQVLIAKPK